MTPNAKTAKKRRRTARKPAAKSSLGGRGGRPASAVTKKKHAGSRQAVGRGRGKAGKRRGGSGGVTGRAVGAVGGHRKWDHSCIATVRIVEQFGAGRDSAQAKLRIPIWNPVAAARITKKNPSAATRQRRGGARLASRDCEAFAALGHPMRAAMLQLLMDGPATYRTLRGATGLAAGPLYHHIKQLRLTRLILPKQRDLYELTRGGRNLYVAAAALASLTRDSRRRPLQISEPEGTT